MVRLLEQYKKKVLPELLNSLGADNVFAVPRLEKVVINAGLGKLLTQQPKGLDNFLDAMRKITGQQPIVKRARKAISAFKIREGQIVGLMVTLRGKRMYEFVDKLVNVALPRSRDFRGISRKGFDGRGNYSLGIREHMIFPEMAQEELSQAFGLQVSIVTTAKDDEAAYQLLKKLGFPFSAESGSPARGEHDASGGKVKR